MLHASTPKKRIRLSSIYESHFESYLNDSTRQLYVESKHLKAVNNSKACRTKRLGIAVYECDTCEKRVHIHRSCKHRFCSRCGASDTVKWAESSLRKLMNIKHHHIVMTMPKPMRQLSKMNGNLIYNIMFKCSSEVMQWWFKQKHGIKPGIVSVLHTSGSDLKYHPHIHMIVSGGGKEIETEGYSELKSDYLTSQSYLGHQLKKRVIRSLVKLYKAEKLQVFSHISTAAELKYWLEKIGEKHWIVSVQKPLDDIQQIIGYVGRYTKRSCLSEYKIKSIDTEVRFEYNDYKNTPKGEKPRIGICKMGITSFLDNLLQHVPDTGFKSVRYYGLYSSKQMKQIPQEYKLKEEFKEEYIFDDDKDWGEHEHLRKNQIKRGKPDPLYCECCERSMRLKYFEYERKDKTTNRYENSS